MDPNVASAIIGAISAFIVAGLTVLVARAKDARAEKKKIRDKYLTPLRLFAEEAHYRTEDMFRFPMNRQLLAVGSPHDVGAQPTRWFNDRGCYFASTCYLTACLFAAMTRVREGIPYLQLRRKKDTELITAILSVSHEFLDDLGVFYLIQHSIGEQMWDTDAARVVTYRTFCETLRDEGRRVWFDRLLQFYIEVGNGGRIDQLRRIQKALQTLSELLDGGSAIRARTQAEESRWKFKSQPQESQTA